MGGVDALPPITSVTLETRCSPTTSPPPSPCLIRSDTYPFLRRGYHRQRRIKNIIDWRRPRTTTVVGEMGLWRKEETTMARVVTAMVLQRAEKLAQIDRFKEGVTGRRGVWCAGQRMGGFRFDNTESSPTSELELLFERRPRQTETS